jgi:phage terminase Nu1 subunit (DNA packaging protein)
VATEQQPEFPAKTIAKLLDVSLARVGQLANEGVITRLPNGRYPADAIPEYIRFIRDGKARKHHDVAAQVENEKLRKLRRENDLEEAKVAPISLLTEALQKAGGIIVANLENLPLLIKRHWPEVTGDQITMVKKAVAECRNAIADMRIDLEE